MTPAQILPPSARPTVQLATLGGTAAEGAPEPFLPPHAGACLMAAVVVLAWAATRPRETSAAAARVPAPGRGRTQPFDEVLLAECAS